MTLLDTDAAEGGITRRYELQAPGDFIKPRGRVRGKGLTPHRIALIESSCFVTITRNDRKAKISIVPNVDPKSGDQCYLKSAEETVAYILEKSLQLSTLTDKAVYGYMEQQKEIEDDSFPARKRARKISAIVKKGAANAFADATVLEREPAKTELGLVNMPAEDSIRAVLKKISKDDQGRALEVFSEDPRVDVRITINNAGHLSAETVTYKDGTTNSDRIDLVKETIITAAAMKEQNQKVKVNYDLLASIIDQIIARKEEPAPVPKAVRQQKVVAAEASVMPVFVARIGSLNGESFRDFIEHYMMNAGRAAALTAFAETPKLRGATVKLGTDATPYAFEVTLPAQDGVADTGVYDFICHVLNEAREVWKTAQQYRATNRPSPMGSSINKRWFEERIAENLKTLDRSPQRIAPIFRSSIQNGLGVEEDKAATLRAIEKLPGRFAPIKEAITLPELNEDNALELQYETLTPTENQKKLMDLCLTKDVVMCDGYAGTGKTFWTAYIGLKGLAEGRYQKICLAAPAVEAGENLGFLPGDKDQKMNPYINQILENMDEILGRGNALLGKAMRETLMQSGVIEIAPHAFNRGRTYKNTFYILDESQNASWDQLMTSLTRLGLGSTFVYTGNYKQNDRTRREPAFVSFMKRFEQPDYAGWVGCITMESSDVKRHPFLQMMAERGDDEPPEAFRDAHDRRMERVSHVTYPSQAPK